MFWLVTPLLPAISTRGLSIVLSAKTSVCLKNAPGSFCLKKLFPVVPGPSVKVQCMYRVSRPGEAANIVATGLGNYRMLWYGTNILNLMSILHKGVQPTESPLSESLPQFGKVSSDVMLQQVGITTKATKSK